jgi:hypothetical protein
LDEQLKISLGKPLVTQGNHADRAAESIAQDGGTPMTLKEMYRHLDMLENVVSQTVCLFSAGPSTPSSANDHRRLILLNFTLCPIQ